MRSSATTSCDLTHGTRCGPARAAPSRWLTRGRSGSGPPMRTPSSRRGRGGSTRCSRAAVPARSPPTAIGGATLECWLKRVAPDRELVVGDYAPATIERLRPIFTEAECVVHDLLGRSPARRRSAPVPPDRHGVRQPPLAGGLRALPGGVDRVRRGRAGRSPRRSCGGAQGPPGGVFAGRLGAYPRGDRGALAARRTSPCLSTWATSRRGSSNPGDAILSRDE